MEFEKNPNIGLYFFVNDKFALLGKKIPEKTKKQIEEVLGVPVINISVLDTDLVGVFVTGNNKYLFIPELLDREKKRFEEIVKDYDMELIEIKNKLNTIGNNFLVGDEEFIVSPDYPKKLLDEIKKKTGMNYVILKHPEFKSAGSVGYFAGGKYLLSQQMEEENFKEIISKIGAIGTINGGSDYISSGVVANKNGVIIGSSSTTVEIQNVVDTFGENE